MTREEQILDRLPQVRLIAAAIHRRLPLNSISFDDLVSAGTIGAIAAVDRFDPSTGLKLQTYAGYKISGAILDSLRELDFRPRWVRGQIRRTEAATLALEQRLGRAPTEDEIARELGLELVDFQEQRCDSEAVMLHLDHENAHGGRPLMDKLPSAEPRADALLAEAEDTHAVQRAVRRLPARERQVIRLHFFAGASLREIGRSMRIHESRASQMKKAALGRLRQALGDRKLAA